MRGAILPLSQYVFMAWCLVKYRDYFSFTFTFQSQGKTLYAVVTQEIEACKNFDGICARSGHILFILCTDDIVNDLLQLTVKLVSSKFTSLNKQILSRLF
jgi:hypothetical protein